MKRLAVHEAAIVLAIIAIVCSLIPAPGCAAAPKSLQQLEAMDEPAYQSWRARVGAWTSYVTATVVGDHPEAREEVRAFGELLTVLAAQPTPPGPGALSDAAAEAGLQPQLVALLVLELQAMLEARGGLPAGPRSNEVIGTIGAAILEGTATP